MAEGDKMDGNTIIPAMADGVGLAIDIDGFLGG